METAFGSAEYFGQTHIHPLGLAAVIVLGLAMIAAPRRWAVAPVIVMACFIAPAQRVAIAGLNFDLLRIMMIFGFVRVIARGELKGMSWRPMDTAVAAWAIVGTLTYSILWQTMNDLVNRLGALVFDGLFAYLVFRALIRSWDDLRTALTAFAVVSAPVAAFFVVEHLTGRNLFSVLGGVPEITMERDGRLRCQGAFAHPILAGVFWAAVLPMLGAMILQGARSKMLAVLGAGCSIVIILMCASSTPVSAVILAAFAFFVWPARRHMRWIRWGLVVALFLLHLVMKQPVWHLLARIDFVGGSTGYHRFLLIDAAIRHIGQWWLLGTKELFDEELFDITNEYIYQGINGGLATMLLFVAIIAYGFQGVGRLWRAWATDRPRAIMAWAMGVALFVHVTSFFAVSYFGQIKALWAMQLAMIASLAPLTNAPEAARTASARRAGAASPVDRGALPGGRRPAGGHA